MVHPTSLRHHDKSTAQGFLLDVLDGGGAIVGGLGYTILYHNILTV